MNPTHVHFSVQSPSLPTSDPIRVISVFDYCWNHFAASSRLFPNHLSCCRRHLPSATVPAFVCASSEFEMSVLIVTSVGDIVVDLHTDKCPLTTKNFLKLCKMKYYNGVLFHKVEKDFMAQTGDRTGTGTGGDSVYKFLYGEQARFFKDEIHPDLKHSKTGTVAMASAGENCNASQFYITLRDEIDYLDGKHTVFGIVEEKEGLDTLAKISEALVDNTGRPFKDIRIKHTYILDDPFDDPPQLAEFIPEKSPEGKPHDEIAEERLEDSWVPLDEKLAPEELEELIHAKEAHTNAAILESIGDIPDAEVKPPENVLFVCKLNPVTEDEDLFTIFSRFGTVASADIIRDYKTGDSLCYAFIEFEDKEACERAYFKMDNTLIDDRRIHVDFSQSVSRLWNQFRHGKGNKPKGAGGGCFKCGAADHFARDCVQGDANLQPGAKYVLKDDQTQHGGYNGKRYDMVLDEDQNDDQKYQERDQTKKQKTEHSHKSEHSTQKHRYGDEKDKRQQSKGEERRKHESRSHEKYHSKPRSEEKSESRDHHRSSGRNRHGYDDRDYKSDSHGKYERDNRRVSEKDMHEEGDYHHRKSSKYRDERERRHRDERR